MKIIKQLIKWINETYNNLVLLSEKTLEINDRLKAIEKVMPKEKTFYSNETYTSIGSVDMIAESVEILRSQILKDYFTKEFLNKEATTTKKLYVVKGDSIFIEYYKDNNYTKVGEKWFEFKGQEYYFI